jgi:hypothetical protein
VKYCLLLLLVACSNSETRWELVARRLNGELFGLRPTAQAIAASNSRNDPAAVRAVIGMCASVDGSLQRIAETSATLHALDVEPGGPHHYMTDVPDNARWLTEHRYDVCGHGDDWRCRDWCVQRWKAFAVSVEALRTHASRHGVQLESLD